MMKNSDEQEPRPPDPVQRSCLFDDITPPQRMRRQRRKTKGKTHVIPEDVNIQWDTDEKEPLRPPVFEEFRQEEEYEEQLQQAIVASLQEMEYRSQEEKAEDQKFRFGLVRSRLNPEDPIERRWIERIDRECTPIYKRLTLDPTWEEEQGMKEWFEKRRCSPVYKILAELLDTT